MELKNNEKSRNFLRKKKKEVGIKRLGRKVSILIFRRLISRVKTKHTTKSNLRILGQGNISAPDLYGVGMSKPGNS